MLWQHVLAFFEFLLVFSWRIRRKTRLLQWLVFFRQFNAIGPLFVPYPLLPYVLSTSFSTYPKPLTSHSKAEGSPFPLFSTLRDFPLFFGTVRLFKFLIFPKFFYCSKGSPIIFLIFCNRMDVQTRRDRLKSAPYLRLKNIQGTTIGNICKKLISIFFQVAQCRKTQKEAIQAH